VALLSETHRKAHKRFFVRNYHIYRNDCHPGAKAGNAVAVRKGVRYNYVDLPPLISILATGFCTTRDKKEILVAVVYKSLIKDWSDTDVNDLLILRNKTVLMGDLNSKDPVWNSQISIKLVTNLLNLQDKTDFHISAPRYQTQYIPSGNGDMLVKRLQRNVRMSDVNVLEIVDSDHLLILFHMLDYVSTNYISGL
jgi:hypothetical protein